MINLFSKYNGMFRRGGANTVVIMQSANRHANRKWNMLYTTQYSSYNANRYANRKWNMLYTPQYSSYNANKHANRKWNMLYTTQSRIFPPMNPSVFHIKNI